MTAACEACGALDLLRGLNIGTSIHADPIAACAACATLPRAVSMIVRLGRSRYLAVSQPPLKWGLPGGKVEKAETFPGAAKRELLEETRLRVRGLRRVHVAPCPGKITYLNVVFEAEVEPGAPIAKDRLQVAWLTRADIEDGPFGAYNHAMFEKMEES